MMSEVLCCDTTFKLVTQRRELNTTLLLFNDLQGAKVWQPWEQEV